jgi:alcohol dehydrogenase class IV
MHDIPKTMPDPASFRFAYDPGVIVYGRGCVNALAAELARIHGQRALVVAGKTTGTTPALIDPVRAGLGDRFVGTFAETTADKALDTAFDGAAQIREAHIDTVISLGGGASLDVAKIMSIIAADDRPRETIRSEFVATKTLGLRSPPLPIIAIPTTLAGADLSIPAGITDKTQAPVEGGVSDSRLMPAAVFYDPALIETTPHAILCASAMNGFDKGIESLYARNATPVTDATAHHGLALLAQGLPRLGAGQRDEATLHDAIVGTLLVQYGTSQIDGVMLSLIHAFGHGITRGYAVQQGGAHGIIAPHALNFLFARVDGRRQQLACTLGVESGGAPEAIAQRVVEAVVAIRDALALPARLSSIEDMRQDDLPEIAAKVQADAFMANAPAGLDATVADLEGVLRQAW